MICTKNALRLNFN